MLKMINFKLKSQTPNSLFITVLLLSVWFQSFGIFGIEPNSKQSDPFLKGKPFDKSKCTNYLSKSIVDQIKSYRQIANQIYNISTQDPLFKGTSYQFLKTKFLKFGTRLSGSPNLENALNFLLSQLKSNKLLTNVHTEEVKVPKLIRISNEAKLFVNGQEVGNIPITGSGTTKSSPIFGLRKEVLYVPTTTNFLLTNPKLIRNKIVVFENFAIGPIEKQFAEASGAKAILVNAYLIPSKVTKDLLFTAVGRSNITIPNGFMTHADNALIKSYSAKPSTKKIEIWMKIIQIYSADGSISKNVVGDYAGRKDTDEIVIVSGHADSWDLVPAAQDDGVGVSLCFHVAKLLDHLKLRPRRTIRTIFWTAEEFGLFGSKAYAEAHKNELGNLSAVLEADLGCFDVGGWDFGGNTKYACILNEVSQLLKKKLRNSDSLFNSNITDPGYGDFPEISTDVASFFPYKVPGANLHGDTKDHDYFKVHHTKEDVLKNVDSDKMDQCLAALTTMTYVMADLDFLMPRIE